MTLTRYTALHTQQNLRITHYGAPMPATPDNYHAYLLRFWRDDAQSPWRIILIDPHTGEQHGFPSCVDLYAFLDDELAGDVGPLPIESTDGQD
jgi:hypothetical protein